MDIKVVNWNVNGIRSIVNKGFNEFIRTSNPDVICLQEVKCNEIKVLNEIFENLGFDFKLSVAEKKGYSGTLIAWKKLLTTAPQIIDPKIFLKSNKTELADIFVCEGRCVVAGIDNYSIINLYIPSGSSSEERQIIKYSGIENLYSSLEDLSDTARSNLILCGDFNICHRDEDIHHPKEATKKGLSGFLPDERKWFTKLLDLGFKDVFREFNPDLREYTWWSFRANSRQKNLGWRLDYFLVGQEVFKKIKYIKQHTEVLGSDHCPIEIGFSIN